MNLEPGTADRLVARLFPEEWEPKGRDPLEPHQVPPKEFELGPATLWLLEAGRGAGKTEAGARFYTRYMREHPGYRGRIIAPTYGDAVEACIEGPSGLKSIDPDISWLPSAPGGSKIVWPNGSEALVLGTHSPKDVDRLRAGGNRHIDWWEEMAANVQLANAWDQAQFGLRLGDRPISIATTTPRNTPAYRMIRTLQGTKRVSASVFDNAAHLPAAFLEAIKKRYEGTRLGRQELYGELLDDIEGALWTGKLIEHGRVEQDEVPEMARLVVSVDPAATSGPEADDTGIIVAGLGINAEVYVWADDTCHLAPAKWGQRAVHSYETWSADMIVGEVNNGGEMVEHVLTTVDPNVPFKSVRASRGKQTRAQPIAALYGDPDRDDKPSRVHHVGGFPELEDQMTTWVPGEDSPDRMDALVWAVTELMLEEQEEVELVEYYDPVTIGPSI